MMYSKIENYRIRLVNILNDFEGTVKSSLINKRTAQHIVELLEVLRDNARDDSLKDNTRLSESTAKQLNNMYFIEFDSEPNQRITRAIWHFMSDNGITDETIVTEYERVADAIAEVHYELYFA